MNIWYQHCDEQHWVWEPLAGEGDLGEPVCGNELSSLKRDLNVGVEACRNIVLAEEGS